jgi:ubiquinone/menaquinone biosynthesis C-methylase UbiE
MNANENTLDGERFPDDIDMQYDVDDVGKKFLAMKGEYLSAGVLHPSTKFIRDHLKDTSGTSLVDIGCGGGDDLAEYLKLGFADAQGVEPSEVMASAARQLLGTRATVALGSWKKLPSPDSSKDFCIGRASLQYEEELDAAYREAARVLKPGGLLLIAVPHPEKAKDKRIVIKDGREYVQDKLFKQVPVTYPRHFMEDYFSQTFSTYFELLEEPRATMRVKDGRQEFDHLVFVARRRYSSGALKALRA